MIHSDNDFATVAYLRVKDAYLEDKEPCSDELLGLPSLLTANFSAMENILAKKLDKNTQTKLLQTTVPADRDAEYTSISLSSKKAGRWVVVSNVQNEAGKTGNSIGDEVDLCFQHLRGREYLDRMRANYLN